MKPFSGIWKHSVVCNKVLFPILFSSNFVDQLSPNLSFIFYAYIGIHQVRRLVFDNYQRCPVSLKTLDTIGNCQRPVFTFGVSQHKPKITNLWKFEHNWSSKLQDKNERKNTLVTKLCAFRCLIWGPQNLILRSQNQIRGK